MSSLPQSMRGGRNQRRPNWAVRPATPLRPLGDTAKSAEGAGDDDSDDDPILAVDPSRHLKRALRKSISADQARESTVQDAEEEDELLSGAATCKSQVQYAPTRLPKAEALVDQVTDQLRSVSVSPAPGRAAATTRATAASKPAPSASNRSTEVIELLDSDSDSDGETQPAHNPYLAHRALDPTKHTFPSPFSLDTSQLSLLVAFRRHLQSARPRPAPTSLLHVIHNKYNITLDNLHTLLSPGGWLNDELINGYLSLAHARLPAAHRARVLVLSTFFYTTLVRHGYDRVRRWVKAPLLSPQGYDRVLVPLNFGNRHWALACVLVDRPRDKAVEVEVAVYDSLPSEARSRAVGKVLADWVRQERNDPSKQDAYGDMGAREVNIRVTTPKCPEQDDGSSCGVFTVAFAVWVMAMGGRGDMPGKVFGQSKQVGMRRRMAFEVCGIGPGRETWEDNDSKL